MLSDEIMQKARGAKSPEELLKLAHENGPADFNEINAVAYFNAMHKSGELSDDELENAAGGCKSNGRRVVTLGNVCPDERKFWRCKHCLCQEGNCRCDWKGLNPIDKAITVTPAMKVQGICGTCGWCSYETGMWYCNSPFANRC